MITKQLPDGVEYQILEPGDPPTPQHDADACGECTFVANADCIVVTPAQRKRAEVTLGKLLRGALRLYDLEDTVIALGKFMLPGWTGHGVFWLFTCPECQQQGVDYLHGHRLYLRCPSCQASWHVTGDRFYEAANLPKPPSRREEEAYLRERRRQLGV